MTVFTFLINFQEEGSSIWFSYIPISVYIVTDIYVLRIYYMLVLVAQSYPTLYDPMDCSPPGSSVHGIFQARILEWVAISFSKVRTTFFQKKFFFIYRAVPGLHCTHRIFNCSMWGLVP